MGELGRAQTLLGVREGDVEQLRIAAKHLLGHLLEGLLLPLSLLLEGLLLLVGLFHPLLGRLLGGLLLLLDLFGQRLHGAEPLRPRTLRPVIHPTARRVPIHHVISLPNVACRVLCVPARGAPEPRPISKDRTRVSSASYSPECVEGEFCERRHNGVLRSSLPEVKPRRSYLRQPGGRR